MLILGLDTSTSLGTVALSDGERLIIEVNVEVERSHVEKLLPLIDSILKKAGVLVSEVDGIAVGLGPGSFTGTRIGVTVARGLAQGLNKSLVGISSLDILVYNLKPTEHKIWAMIDAKRNEVYTASYRFSDSHLGRLNSYQAIAPVALARQLADAGEKVILVGNGLAAYQEIFRKFLKTADFAPPELWFPRASRLIVLALPRFLASQTDDIFQLVPLYVRDPDAKTPSPDGHRGR